MDVLTVFGWVPVKAAGCLLLIACVELAVDLHRTRQRRRRFMRALERWIA